MAICDQAARASPATPDEEDDLVVGEPLGLVEVDEHPVVEVEEAEALGDLDVLEHRAAEDADLAVELLRHVEHNLEAVDGRGEGGDDDAPFGLVENLLEGRDDGALRGRAARHGRVGRVGGEREHALLPVAAEGAQVDGLADDGRLVHLVVAGVG